jgi:carboxyl-terminal processing protease
MKPPRHSMMMIRWLTVSLLFGATLAVSRLYSKEVAEPEGDDAYAQLALFTRALEEIRSNYVDPDLVGYDTLIRGALQGMMDALDEHSQFLDAEMYGDMQDDTRGQFGGLGIVISMKDGGLTIVSPMEDTPGFRAGLMPEDRILKINDFVCEGIVLSDAVTRLRGEPGTKVTLTVLRPKTQEVREIELERAEIKVASVKDTRMAAPGIGYIRITQFNEPTAESLQKAIDELRQEGMQALVLDLRNNPGGLLRSAIDVSQKFLDRREVIVSTQGRREEDQQIFRAAGRERLTDLPMVVLVNGGSASASEIVAGALQDHHRAVLIGEKTFGKGSVQSVLPMEEGTALRLTTARYFTPANRMIHEKGIEPDIVVPMSPENWRSLMMQRAREENPSAFTEDDEALLVDVTDVQLERALSVLKGIMTYQARMAR